MGFIKAYFLLPSKGKFISEFNNDQLKEQARAVWSHLDNQSLLYFIAAIILGIVSAYCYYKPFNNKPGRHYQMKFWWAFLFITAIVSFLATLGALNLTINTHLKDNLMSLYGMFSLNNMLYSIVLYFISSVVWCNTNSTNAYPCFKFR